MVGRPSRKRSASGNVAGVLAKATAAAAAAAPAVVAGAGTAAVADDELTEYERERLAKIEENRRIMMELSIPVHASNLEATKPTKKPAPARRGVGASRSRASSSRPDPDAPRRTSLRVQGIAADGKMVVEEKHGKLVTSEGAFEVAKGSSWRPQDGRAAEDVSRERHPPGLLPFASVNSGPDEAYLELLRRAMGAADSSGGGGDHGDDDGDGALLAPATAVATDDDEDAPILKRRGPAPSGDKNRNLFLPPALAAAAARAPALAAASSSSPSTAAAVAASKLAERDVVKVVRDGCVHLAWHPGCGRGALLASACKKGSVSLFDLDRASEKGAFSAADVGGGENRKNDDDDDDGDEAGVVEFFPHHSYVCGLRWAAGGRLFTASYDGSIRVLDASASAPPPLGSSGKNSNLGSAGGKVDGGEGGAGGTRGNIGTGGGVFAPAILHSDAEWSAFDCTDDGRLGVVADKGGEALLFDPRAGAASAVADAAAKAASAASAASASAPAGDGPEEAPRHAFASSSVLPKCVVAAFSLHEKKINTVSIDVAGGGSMFAVSGSDGSIRVFDLRKMLGNASPSRPSSSGGGKKIICGLGADSSRRAKVATPVMEGGHSYSCQAAFFAPDGSGRIVSTSRDNTVKIWDVARNRDAASALKSPMVTIRHDNNTGRWITPFRAVWTPRADGVVLGGMKRTMDVYSAADGRQLAALRSEHQTAIGSRVAIHAERPLMAAATASGRVNVWRNE